MIIRTMRTYPAKQCRHFLVLLMLILSTVACTQKPFYNKTGQDLKRILKGQAVWLGSAAMKDTPIEMPISFLADSLLFSIGGSQSMKKGKQLKRLGRKWRAKGLMRAHQIESAPVLVQRELMYQLQTLGVNAFYTSRELRHKTRFKASFDSDWALNVYRRQTSGVFFRAEFTLYDKAARRLLFSKQCVYKTPPGERIAYQLVTANDSAFIKRQSEKALQFCVRHINMH